MQSRLSVRDGSPDCTGFDGLCLARLEVGTSNAPYDTCVLTLLAGTGARLGLDRIIGPMHQRLNPLSGLPTARRVVLPDLVGRRSQCACGEIAKPKYFSRYFHSCVFR